MNKLLFAVAALFISLFSSVTQAQSIKRDPSFGDKGTIYLKDSKFDYTTLSLFQDPATEEMLNAGTFYDYDNDVSGLFFSKTKANGDLDQSFATDGILRLSESEYPFPNILRIRQGLDKGFLVLLGNADLYNADSTAIICFTSKGKIVSDFGIGGFLSSKKGLIKDFDLLADSKVLALSTKLDTTTFQTSNWFSQYSQLGILETSYGDGGFAGFEGGFSEYVRMDKSGQTYLCSGNSLDISNLTFLLAICKVNPLGVQDKTFGAPKLVFGSPAPENAFAFPLNLQILKDGSYLLDGYSVNIDSFTTAGFVTKIDKLGKTVNTFGKAGYLEFTDLFEGEFYTLSAMELPNSQILVTNTDADDNSKLEMSFSLFDNKGGIVKSFGTKGNQRMKIEGLETTVVSSFISPTGKIFVAGDVTNKDDIYESQISKLLLNTVAVADEEAAIGNLAVFPNPMADKATIKYELAETMPVSIDMYDIKGCKVQSFFNNQTRIAGKQTEELKLNIGIAPGVYMLQISSAQHSIQTIKIVKI
ncbi:MAG: T9SS type A sorting domain-containing protein [Saprospiraceae bacterium]